MSIIVEKIGGENAADIKNTLASIIEKRNQNEWAVYVISAFRSREFNTTSYLIEAWEFCRHGDRENTLKTIKKIQDFYLDTIRENISTHSEKVEFFVQSLFSGYIQEIHSHIDSDTKTKPTRKNDYSIEWFSFLGLGEVITAKIYSYLLSETMESYVDTANMHSIPVDISILRSRIGINAIQALKQSNVAIVPGYIGRLDDGILSTWNRGYSEPALIQTYKGLMESGIPGIGLELRIQKMYPICSADPRVVWVEKVRTLSSLSLSLAKEMVDTKGADGGFINPHALDPSIFASWGKLRVYSPDNQEGSLVSLYGNNQQKGILSIQSKSVVAFSVISYRLGYPGYYEKIWDFFAQNDISLNDAPSNETGITLPVNMKEIQEKDIESIRKSLEVHLMDFEKQEQPIPSVDINYICTIHIWWEDINYPGVLESITGILANASINIEMLSQTANAKAIVVGVKPEDEMRSVQILHEKLIENMGAL